MTLASSIKSSSLIVPSFIILTATSILALHLPRRTTPNCPDPNSSSRVSSDGSISHLSWLRPAVAGIDRSPTGGILSRQAKPPLLCLRKKKYKDKCYLMIDRWKQNVITDDSWQVPQWLGNSASRISRIPVCCFVWCGNAWLAAWVCNLNTRKVTGYRLSTKSNQHDRKTKREMSHYL